MTLSLSQISLVFLNWIVNLTILFLVYIVWRHSPPSMAKFKYYMLKMVLVDLLFSITLGYFFQPIIYLPLPLAGLDGPMKYLGPNSAKIALFLTVCVGVATLFAVNDCCRARCAIIYGRDDVLRRLRGLPGTTWVIFIHLVVFSFVFYFVFWFSTDLETMTAYAQRHNSEKYLAEILRDQPLVMFDADDRMLLVPIALVVGTLCITEGQNLFLLAAVERRLREAVIPFFSISIPTAIIIFAFFFNISAICDSKLVGLLLLLIIGLYPLLDCLLFILLMKPYRIKTRRIIGKVIPCLKPSETISSSVSVASVSYALSKASKI